MAQKISCSEKGEATQAGVTCKGFTEEVGMRDELSVHIRNDQIEEEAQASLAGRSRYQCSQHLACTRAYKRWEAYLREMRWDW